MTRFTVELDPPVADALIRAAQARDVRVEQLIADVTHAFVAEEAEPFDDWTPEDIAAIEQGMAQLKRGEGVPQAEVMARLRAKHGW